MPRLEKLADHSFGQTVGDMQVGCVFVGDAAVTLSLSGNLNVIESLLKPLPETLYWKPRGSFGSPQTHRRARGVQVPQG